MRKFYLACLPVLIVCLCGCSAESSGTAQTRFLLDTVVTLTADCDEESLDGAFEVCSDYEKLLSKTVPESDVSRINSSSGEVKINRDTAKIIERSLYYCALSGGRYDITVYPLTLLWDFKNEVIPEKKEIAEALKNVDYQSVKLSGDCVNTNGKQIDLGSVAKGFIADKITEYLKENGAKKGIVNLGGNVEVFGKEYNVGIKKPFSEDTVKVLKLKDCSAVTSGIYERYIEKDGKIYHHVLDTETGYGVENDLASVTVVGKSSMDCDALSTVLLLSGLEKGLETVNSMDGYCAVFITRDGKTVLSDGVYEKNGYLYINQ